MAATGGGKDKVQLPEDGSVQVAIKAFHGPERGDTEERFLVLGYANENTLKVCGSGAGGLAAIPAELLPNDECRYVLLRKVHKVELATTVKFAYVDWTPGDIKPTRRALLSTHKSQVEAILKPHHVTLQASQRSELDDNVISQKIGFSSGTSSFVTERKAESAKQIASAALASAAKRPELVPQSALSGSAPVSLEDEAALKMATAAVRSDADATNWLLLSYLDADCTRIGVVSMGSEGVDEMVRHFTDDRVFYGLFRVNETFDKTVTTKFGFVKLLSAKVPPVRRAQISTHLGYVQRLLQPYHVEFYVDHAHEISSEIVALRLREVMGTKNKVLSEDESKAHAAKKVDAAAARNPLLPASAAVDTSLVFTDEEELKSALKEVHTSGADWALVAYTGKNTLDLVAKGAGGLSELLDKLQADAINFALLRLTERVDQSLTTKFVYIKWQPEAVSYMRKAEVSTKKGAIDDLFRPFHIDIFTSSKDDLSEAAIRDRLGAQSGAKSAVK